MNNPIISIDEADFGRPIIEQNVGHPRLSDLARAAGYQAGTQFAANLSSGFRSITDQLNAIETTGRIIEDDVKAIGEGQHEPN